MTEVSNLFTVATIASWKKATPTVYVRDVLLGLRNWVITLMYK